MTFSAKIKLELCRPAIEKGCCALAEAYGALLLGNTFTKNEIRIVTTHEGYASRLPRLFGAAFGFQFDECGRGQGHFFFTASDKAARIWEAVGHGNAPALHLNNALVVEDCCQSAFWRGAFLSGGSVTDPLKSYHLELLTPHLPLSRELSALFGESGLRPSQTRRSGVQIMYFKASEQIEDFLTLIGAPLGALEIMEKKVEKSLRNHINRRVNCETGNVGKTVEAAARQRGALLELRRSGRWEGLPDSLKDAALARLEYPEDSLSELSERLGIGRSALNHRLRKLELMTHSESG